MGTKVAGAAVKGLMLTVTGYMYYRLRGGPPIKNIISAYRKLRAEEKLAKSKKVVLRESEFVVA